MLTKNQMILTEKQTVVRSQLSLDAVRKKILMGFVQV